MNTAMRDLDADADAVQALLDEGKLIGFDIFVRRGRQATVCVLTHSLDYYWKTGRGLSLEWPELFQSILPAEKMFLLGMDVQRCLNCDGSHVTAMIRAGHLQAVRKSRSGLGGSPMIARNSFETFLKGRKL